MQEPKMSSFNERAAASAEAKKALLAKFKPKPTVADPDFKSREARRQEELEVVRAARQAEREALRQAQAEAQQAQQQATIDAELDELDAKRKERKERKALAKAEARAKREAKSAGRR